MYTDASNPHNQPQGSKYDDTYLNTRKRKQEAYITWLDLTTGQWLKFRPKVCL